MKIQPRKEERLLSLLLEGETIGAAVEITEKEFPANKRIIVRKDGVLEVLD